jgi:putative ABC transport system permease protein
MTTLWHNLQFAFRQLAKNPSYAAIVILTLALGIGANTAIFTVVNVYMIKPLPLPHPDRLVQIWESWQDGQGTVSMPDLKDWREQNTVFEGLAAYQAASFNLSRDGSPEQVSGREVTANYFDVMEGKPALGRTFAPSEDEQGHQYEIVMSDALWRRLGADPSLVGKKLALDSRDFDVIGVMPPEFRFPSATAELWVPLVPNPKFAASRDDHEYTVVGRIKPGVSLQMSVAEMKTIATRLEKTYPDSNKGRTVLLIPFQQQLTSRISQSLSVLMVAVAFVFLIACANVVNLNLTRTASRQREFAIRRAMGAGGARLFGQFVTESVFVTAAGGFAGWFLAQWGVQLLVAANKSPLPTFARAEPDIRVFGLTFFLGLITALLLASANAWKAMRVDIQHTLKEGGRNVSPGKMGQRVNKGLVVAEIASTVILLSGAGLMVRSLVGLGRVNPGFVSPEKILTMKLGLSPSSHGESRPVTSFLGPVMEHLSAVSGVEAAGAITMLPMQESWTNGNFEIVGVTDPKASQQPESELRAVYGDYYRAMGVPLIRGRYITVRDTKNSEPVAIINQTAAKRYWNGTDPLGSHIKIGGGDSPAYAIVGVVQDSLQSDPSVRVQAEVDVPFSQWPVTWPPELIRTFSIVVRSSSNPTELAGPLSREIQSVDPTQPVFLVKTMQRVIDESTAATQFSTFFLVVFAVVALSLAAVGIYGVLSYGVRGRTHEIGIRMALGANPGRVLRMVIGEGLVLDVIGLSIGVTVSLYLTRFISSLLFGVKQTDAPTFVGVAILISFVVLLACYIPARRAMKVDPIEALRYE